MWWTEPCARPRAPSLNGALAALLACSACGHVLADEVSSPLSMVYVPGPGRALLTSTLGAESTDAQLRSLVLNRDGRSHFGLLTQAVDFGLSEGLVVSVSEVYAHAFERNPLDVAEGRVGFRSPKFQLSAWQPVDLNWTIKSGAGLQFNPGNSSRLNYGLLFADLVYQPTRGSDTALSLGWVATAHKDISSHSQTWRAEWQTSLGPNLLRLRAAQTRLAAFTSRTGPMDPSVYTTAEIEAGRPLAQSLWGSLVYAQERNQFRWLQPPLRIAVSSQRQVQRLSVALRWAWGGPGGSGS